MEKDHDDSSDGDNHSEDVDDGPSPEEGDYKLFWFLRIPFLQFLNNPNGLIVIHCLFGIASGHGHYHRIAKYFVLFFHKVMIGCSNTKTSHFSLLHTANQNYCTIETIIT
ncbi:unnamed protein product [Clavelina lepadiformis]|uniref:Uncharacterized protein n=1 Tax=Clavelina lepadiformis TaxID=159417 RepID=A0ABP0G474_CLALP